MEEVRCGGEIEVQQDWYNIQTFLDALNSFGIKLFVSINDAVVL